MRPWIIAHRGARDEAIENTRAAFDKALTYPIDGIELDLRMTKDKTVIVWHDRTLFKLNASRKYISHHTYDQLRALSPEKQMLTLSETLKLYAHRTRLMLEIKSDASDRNTGRNLELTDKVMAELRNPKITPYLDNIFILSFDAEVLKSAYQKFPDLKYVLNLSDSDTEPTGPTSIIRQPHSDTNSLSTPPNPPAPFPEREGGDISTPLSFQGRGWGRGALIANHSETDYLYAVCVNRKYLSEKLVKFAHHSQKQVMTYTCNTAKQARQAISLNADVVMTDKPGWLTRLEQP